MKIQFETRVVLDLEHTGGPSSKHISTRMNLNCSSNIDNTLYMDETGFPTKEGSLVMTNVLIQGLVCNIHQSQANGFRNDSEHLRYIIAELERGFASVVEVGRGDY
jgi:hypothetical protein